jgi:hypothetical protein
MRAIYQSFLAIAFGILCVSFAIHMTVFAQTDTTASSSTSTAPVQATSSTPAPQTNSTAQTGMLKEADQKRIINLTANVSNTYDAVISRLQNSIDRLNGRIEKTAATGVDVTAARQALNRAQTTLTSARTIMATIDSEVVTAVTSTTPRQSWTQVLERYTTTKNALRETYTTLQEVIRLLTPPSTP